MGAGASCEAGYPLALNLMDSIRDEAIASHDPNYSKAWDIWDKYRRSTGGIIKSLINSPNPEVVLSVPDLFEIALTDEDQRQFENAARKPDEQADEALNEYDEYLKSETREQKQEAIYARDHFLECLDNFFRRKHVRDLNNQAQRTYLQKRLTCLRSGDVVITLNWDTTAERTLCEAGLWNPTDGYGFQKNLLYYPSEYKKPQEVPSNFPRTSVKVLKLHGSFGWRVKESEDVERSGKPQIIFNYAGYLQHFPFKHKNCNYVFKDSWKGSVADFNKLALLYPSFLKRIEIPQLQKIWYEASDALRSADEVDICGYSLPESDTAVRVLFSCLRFRSQDVDVQVTVHDKSDETLERWRAFLGEKAILEKSYC